MLVRWGLKVLILGLLLLLLDLLVLVLMVLHFNRCLNYSGRLHILLLLLLTIHGDSIMLCVGQVVIWVTGLVIWEASIVWGSKVMLCRISFFWSYSLRFNGVVLRSCHHWFLMAHFFELLIYIRGLVGLDRLVSWTGWRRRVALSVRFIPFAISLVKTQFVHFFLFANSKWVTFTNARQLLAANYKISFPSHINAQKPIAI